MPRLLPDLRYAARGLARRPGFTAVAVLTLSVGIGANTAIFSAVNTVLLRPLPFHETARLVTVHETHPVLHQINTAYPDFLDWRQQSQSFESIAAYTFQGFRKLTLTGRGEPVQLQGTFVSQNLLPLLGIRPDLGRGLLPEEEQPGHDRVVLLSHASWIRDFRGDPRIIGKSAALNGESYKVIGVLPTGRTFPLWADVFAPLSRLDDDNRTSRKYHQLEVVALLKTGVSMEQANTEIQTIAKRLGAAFPATNNAIGAELTPFREQFVADARRPLLILLAAAGLILLIACANVANLLLAHGAGRRRELAVRAALGASRSRLIRQLLTETLLLALAGSVPGILIASRAARVLGVLAPDAIQLSETATLDSTVLTFSLGVTVLTAIGFGLLPAMAASRVSLNSFLGERVSGVSRTGGRVRNILVAAEVAMAVVVLISAGLLVRSFSALLDIDPGFRSDHVLTMQVALAGGKYAKPEQVANFYQRLLPRVTALPGVAAAALASTLPLTSNASRSRFGIEGEPTPAAGHYPVAQIRVVTPDYFRILRIPLRRGRGFTPADDDQNLCLINETLARRFYPGRDPIGRKLLFGVVGPSLSRVPIVGVVADTREDGLNIPAEPEVYFAGESNVASLVVKTVGDPVSLGSAVRAAVAAEDRDLAVSSVRTMDEVVAASLVRRRWATTLLSGFAAVALLLAAVGLYGVLAYTVTERTREIGLRMALGGQRVDVLRLILEQGMGATVTGLLAGIVLAMIASRWLTTQLYGIAGADPVTYAAVSLLLLVVALTAIFVPARRALAISPIEALRYD